MLNIGGWELLIILLVALVFLGPERLPGVARQVGQTVNTLRGLAQSFQTELEAAARPDTLVGPADNTSLDTGVQARQALAESSSTSDDAFVQDTVAEDDASRAADLAADEATSAPEPDKTDTDELAAKAREVSADTASSDIKPVSPVNDGGPTDLTVDEEE